MTDPAPARHPRGKIVVLASVVVAVAFSALVVLFARGPASEPVPPAPEVAPGAAPVGVDVVEVDTALPTPLLADGAVDRRMLLRERVVPSRLLARHIRESETPGRLASPEATVREQVELLLGGRDEEFRATFLPEVQPALTPEALARCRERLQGGPMSIHPDWETAEHGESGGHPVVRVSMFGRGLTGFHDVMGHWLADAPWCVPTGVP